MLTLAEEGRIRWIYGQDCNPSGIGYVAIAIAGNPDPWIAMPIGILAIGTALHDGGEDASASGTPKGSRKKNSGLARRDKTRRENDNAMRRRVDEVLRELGYPVDQARSLCKSDIGSKCVNPWKIRVDLVSGKIENEHQRRLSVAIAVRHICRHRGWRNSYTSIATMESHSDEPSEYYLRFLGKVNDALAEHGRHPFPEDERLTVAQTAMPLILLKMKFRGVPKNPVMRADGKPLNTEMAKIHQSDYYYELTRIFEVQGLPMEDLEKIADAVFHQESPRRAVESAGWCPLNPGRHCAPRASLAFQRFRIATTISNLRIFSGLDDDGNRTFRRLDGEELRSVYDALTDEGTWDGDDPSWGMVPTALGISPGDLDGSGRITEDGRSSVSSKHPPILDTERILRQSKFYKKAAPFREWWGKADEHKREVAIEYLGNAGIDPTEEDDGRDEALSEIFAVLDSVDEKALVHMDDLGLPSGRASFSVPVLNKLTERMLDDGLDLHVALHEEYGLPLNADLRMGVIRDRTGSPVVDRTLKLSFSVLDALIREYGPPEAIVIENVRYAFNSAETAKKYRMEANRRRDANLNDRRLMVLEIPRFDSIWNIRRGSLLRYQALRRQGYVCPYCGEHIDFDTCELDHIVPLSGGGSTGDVHNLVAVCPDCNRAKNGQLFHKWAGKNKRAEVKRRVRQWPMTGFVGSSKDMTNFKNAVKERLDRQTPDEAMDADSLESTAWMARELAARLRRYLARKGAVSEDGTEIPASRVRTFSGSVTAWARFESWTEQNLSWIGGGDSKNRRDLRHHAIDAAVIAMMRPTVAQVLAQRAAQRIYCEEMDIDVRLEPDQDYRKIFGRNEQEEGSFKHWLYNQAPALSKLVCEAASEGRVRVVTAPRRYRFEVGRAHKDGVKRLAKKRVGDALSAAAIDKAETEALWTALTRCPDYDPETGLPEDRTRTIRVKGDVYGPDDVIKFAVNAPRVNGRPPTNAELLSHIDDRMDCAALPVSSRHGWAEAGLTIHHARIYRFPNERGDGWSYGMLRVFQHDLRRHTREDLFTAELRPSSMALRTADPKVRRAVLDGTAEYVGFLTVGDEVVFDDETAPFAPVRDGSKSDRISKLLVAYPELMDHGPVSYEIVGFPTPSKISLRPVELGKYDLVNPPAEGSGKHLRWKDRDRAVRDVEREYGSHDWTVSEVRGMYKVLSAGAATEIGTIVSHGPTFIRRTRLGNVRWKCDTHVPLSWRLPGAPRTSWDGKVIIPRNRALELSR